MAQQQSGSSNVITIPRLDNPFVDEQRVLSPPWHRFLIDLWRRTGSSSAVIGKVAYLLELLDGSVGVFDAQSNTKLGTLLFASAKGGLPVAQVLGASPFVFVAPAVGSLAISSGAIEIERQGFRTSVGVTGGSLRLLPQDIAHVTWYGATPPTIVWYPDQ